MTIPAPTAPGGRAGAEASVDERFDRRLGRRRRRKPGPASVDLAARLKENPAFATLSDSDITAILDRTETRIYGLGDVILRHNGRGEGLFVLRQGKVRVVDESDPANPVNLVVLSPGAVFGERSLLFDVPVSATVRAAGRIAVQTLPIPAFRSLVKERPEIAQTMADTIRRYERYNFIRTVPNFAGLTAAEVELLLEGASEVNLAAGETLIAEGEAEDRFYAVRSGELLLTAAPRLVAATSGGAVNDVPELPPARLVGVRRATDTLGLHGVFNADARSPAVAANAPTLLFRWPIETVRKLAQSNSALRESIATADRIEREQRETILSGTAEDSAAEASPTSAPRLHARLAKTGAWWGRARIFYSDDRRLDGIACVASAAAWFGLRLDLARLVDDQLGGHAGDTLVSLARKSEEHGLVSRLLRVSSARLIPAMVPFVFVGPDGRLAVAISVTPDKLTYAGAGTGAVETVSRAKMAAWWGGQALAITSVPDFGAAGQRKVSLPKQFLPMLKPHRGTLFRLMALTLLTLSIGIILPLFSEVIIDRVLVFDDRSLLLLMLFAILFASIMSLVSEAARSLLTVRVANLVNGVLMTRLFAHVLAVPMSLLSKWRVGDLSVRFEENEKILGLATGIAQVVILDVISLLLFGGLLLAINPLLALACLSFAAATAVIIFRASPHLRARDQAVFEARRGLQSHLIEMFDGIETIKFSGQEDDFTDRGQALIRRATLAEIRSARLSFRVGMAAVTLATLSSLVAFGLGGYMVVSQTMTAGTMVAFAGLLGGVMGPLQRLAHIYDSVQELRVAIGRVNDVLQMPREVSAGTAPCPPIKGHLRLENVSFAYDPSSGRNILTDIDLDIAPGQKVALVGPSGSGKSTLAKLINRLLEPTAGRVLIDEIDIAQLEVNSLRRQVGVVEQSPYVFAGTIRENIAKASPDLPFERVATAARLSGAADFIERMPMGYNTRIGEGGRSLSGGQAQRLIIARALANDPGMLILDEATSALDTESERAVQKSIDVALAGRTVVAIAHRLTTIRNADLIVVLKQGRIVEKGTHDELMRRREVYFGLVMSGEGVSSKGQKAA